MNSQTDRGRLISCSWHEGCPGIYGGSSYTTAEGARAEAALLGWLVDQDAGKHGLQDYCSAHAAAERRRRGVRTRSGNDVTGSVARIQAQSGMNWKELGLVFGVSSRAVRGWSLGMRTSPAQDSRIEEFAVIVQGIQTCLDDPSPAAVRAELLRPGADGISVVGRLRRERSGGPTWGMPFGPEYFIDAIRP